MARKPWQKIEACYQKAQYAQARKMIYQELKKTPNDHWYLTRLSGTYYEEHKYKKALEMAQKAKSLAPTCPLVLWDFAGALDMLGRMPEAIAVWKKLIKRGVSAVAHDPCGEGLSWTRELLVDCRYRIGHAYKKMGKRKLALRYYRTYLKERSEGIKSIYNKRQVRIEMSELGK